MSSRRVGRILLVLALTLFLVCLVRLVILLIQSSNVACLKNYTLFPQHPMMIKVS
jgi:hypothetical protein